MAWAKVSNSNYAASTTTVGSIAYPNNNTNGPLLTLMVEYLSTASSLPKYGFDLQRVYKGLVRLVNDNGRIIISLQCRFLCRQ